MAAKVVRQAKNIALLGAPTSAASLALGHELAPAALRAAGLAARLTAAGFAVTDYGDCTTRAFQQDEEHPRARNVGEALAALEELVPKIEVAVKSGALPLVLAGDDTTLLAVIAGARRYYRNVSLLDVDRDAGLNVPASTPSGCLDGMVISHVSGRGAPELVRFWGEPPLVREPDVAIFGIARLDEPERQLLERSPLRRYPAEDVRRMGAAAAAEHALERTHGSAHEFVLHVDLDVIAAEDFRATNLAGSGGLRLAEVREALAVWVRHPNLAALVIAGYNPALDPDGAAANQVIDLLVEVLSPRLQRAAPSELAPAEKSAAPPPVPVEPAGGAPPSVLPESEASATSEGMTEELAPATDSASSMQSSEPRSEPEASS